MNAVIEKTFSQQLAEAWETVFVRQLDTGEWACVRRFIYTFGLLVGVSKYEYRTRFCYEHLCDAVEALMTWNGEGDPPGPWIKEKGEIERANPHYFKGIPIVTEQRESQ